MPHDAAPSRPGPRPRRLLAAFRRLSIRNKLLAMVLLPLLVVLPLLGVILLAWVNLAFDRLLITKIRADLAVAEGYFDRVLGEVGASTAAVADSHALHLALATATPGGDAAVVPLLERFRQRERLDFINLRGADGRLRAQVVPDAAPGGRTSVEVLGPQQLAVLGPRHAERAGVPLLATRNARPSERSHEARSMVLLATRPVTAPDGRLLGHVQGGVLLNRNLPLIDHINEIVYPQGSLPFGSQGTATLFLDDVRISTNVRLFGGVAEERAIGTRVSQTVREAVLEQGSTWLGRAFVVNDWYVSAYKPLADSAGQRVGMLYVGYLEAPFRVLKYGVLGGIGVVFFAVMIAAAVVSLRLAREIFSPIERMDATMRRIEGGALDARVGPVDSQDEIGRLATHLDEVLATLQRWHAQLDAKVAERTQQLEDTQARLVRSEKMATIGQLTASIAHEVNNPIAVIQGNLDLLRTLLPPPVADEVRAELALIDQQIERMRLIVTQLLQFARPGEFAGYVERVDPRRLLEDCLLLVSHQLATTRIQVERALAPVPPVAINRQELQQVLVNLLVNAVHAMPEGGTLGLSSRTDEDGRVALAICDTGPGLPPELIGQLFRPFVTRKKDGTGLGLWISRGIVERYGGDIQAGNREDGLRGARFVVVLPADADARPEAAA
ncbi:cache domain-containing protein [Piscinibacter sakaiensis]|uniref:sensor histidine kinase n=1 Tax=Piscinibacter sakaiensis TaxID=1547922 RepID=UPI00372BB734